MDAGRNGGTSGGLESDADRAAARGDIAGARRLLEQVTAAEPDRIEPWLKLTALCRAGGDLEAAFAAVSGALRIDPLGTLPLLLKASLFEAMKRDDEAGETYGYALAQLPEAVPPHLARMVAHARERHEAYLDKSSARLAAAAASSGAALGAEEQARLARFQSNILRRTRPFHCEPTHFHFPGLREREFHDRSSFPWLPRLEAATDSILREFRQVLASEQAELVPYVQYPEDIPLRQWATLNRSRAWTAIHLVHSGEAVPANARHCPETLALLEDFSQPRIPGRGPNAMFSLLAPGAHIPPHHGVANTRLVCHLPLIVPPGCWFRVGAERREWEVGRAWLFDDTIEHEAMNPSDALRVILIFDTWHPDLSEAERTAVAAVTGAAGVASETDGL